MNAARAPRGDTPGPLSFRAAGRRRSALSLLELAAVLAVTSIVATLPYVAYRTHSVRSQVREGVALAATLTPLVAEAIHRDDRISAELSTAIPVAFEKTLASTSVIDSITVIDGRIDVVFGGAAHEEIVGRRISLTPYETADLHIVWICGNDSPGPGLNPLGFARGGPQAVQLTSTVEPRYLTTDCR